MKRPTVRRAELRLPGDWDIKARGSRKLQNLCEELGVDVSGTVREALVREVMCRLRKKKGRAGGT